MLKNFLKDYFSYSRRERNGIIILSAIILIIIIAYLLLPFVNNNKEFNYKEYESKLKDFEKSLTPLNKQKLYNVKENSGKNYGNQHELFSFNPNTANIIDLEKLGFNEQVIRNIIKYRNKGGYFHKKEDLLKIYGMDTSLFYRIVSCIYLAQNDTNCMSTEEYGCNTATEYYKAVNINKADRHMISELIGIEDLLSERIIKYRNLLGGFTGKNQFNEVYGMKNKQYNLIASNVFIDTTLIRKININSTDEQTLDKHPYLNKFYAKAIMKYKNYTGEIKNINELSVNNILPENIFSQIKPYLSVN